MTEDKLECFNRMAGIIFWCSLTFFEQASYDEVDDGGGRQRNVDAESA